MDSRLMIEMELEKSGFKFSFSTQQHAPFKIALEAIYEFQGQILSWQKISEEREAAAKQAALDQQKVSV